jgi:hypothetical protein
MESYKNSLFMYPDEMDAAQYSRSICHGCFGHGQSGCQTVMRAKKSRLEIDLRTIHGQPASFSGSNGLLCVDVVSRQPVRRLEVFSEDLHIDWSGPRIR